MEVLVSLAIISIVFVIILEIFSQGLFNIGSYRDYSKGLIKRKVIWGKVFAATSPEMLRELGLTFEKTDVKNLYRINGKGLQGEIYRFFAP